MHDSEKFLELLEPAYGDAVKYCRALCSNLSADDAQDVLQQALLKAPESFESLNDRDKFRSWFLKIITRVFYTHLRRHFWSNKEFDLKDSDIQIIRENGDVKIKVVKEDVKK